jgi:hypothetical protein
VGGGLGCRCKTKTTEANKKHSARAEAAVDVGGQQEVDDGTVDLE